ncbi:MAG TPA: hypothetical protein VLA89_03215 [Gemmatimonadales bacterium]|nr:hypothetical protein [Gemmatimonadales bacterium]
MRRRDLRDPETLGKLLRTLTRSQKVPVLKAADELPGLFVPDYVSPDCVGRYGKPEDVKPRWEEIQIR